MTTAPHDIRRVCVLGLGYIGLPLAATLATRGVDLIGVDIDEGVVAAIEAGRSHFAEPDLDMLVQAAIKTGRLTATTRPQPADAYVIAVPTPLRSDCAADLSAVEAACRSLAPVLTKGALVVVESTCPIGTTEQVCRWLGEERPDLAAPSQDAPGDYAVAYCPERILPGRMLFELIENDRVIGGVTPDCARRAEALYRLFVRGALVRTSARVAEAVKLAENAYRDVNIAFANELAALSERVGIDVWEVIGLANRHPRVDILRPGPGVGGHCIAIDPWFLIAAAPEAAPLMTAARNVNDARPGTVVARALARVADVAAPRIACLGLAYKANVDDTRESPAVEIVSRLAEAGCTVRAVDPHVRRLPAKLSDAPGVRLVDLDTALDGCDLVLLLVGHDAFAGAVERLRRLPVLDTVGLLRAGGASHNR